MSKASKIKELIDSSMYENKLTNDELVQIMEQVADYLNLQKVSDYSKENNITPKGVYKCREVIDFRGFKYVIDND